MSRVDLNAAEDIELNELSYFSQHFLAVGVDSVFQDTTDYTLDLRNLAMVAGWPFEIYSQLTVVYNEDGSIGVKYPDDIKEKVLALEEGTSSRVTNPVIRNFLRSISHNREVRS